MLFDVIPGNFFGPLAAPGRIVYWECICILYRVTSRQLSFGIERDTLVDELQYYFESSMAADVPEDEQSVSDPAAENLPEEMQNAAMTARDKANLIIRRLESYGWIYTDVDYSYVQRVHFRDYAIQIIRTLLSVSDEKRAEYQGYIYTIYSLARNRGNPGIGLTQIVDNTKALITGLKSLNANIKKYIDDLTKHSSVSEILDALLNDYYSNVVDKAYHRLLTSDNVAKFRPEIIERLEADSRSNSYLSKASKEIAELREISDEEAREEVLGMLHNVISAFKQMDEILEEINKKNTRYQRAAIGRARFLLSSSEDIRGQLKEILSFMNDKIQSEQLDYNQIAEIEEIDRLIRIFSWDYLDMDSLYAPAQGRKEFVPQEIAAHEIDERARALKRLSVQEKLAKILTPERINVYVHEQLADRKSMKASELPLRDDDTFIRMIYIRLYGQRKNMDYKLKLLDRVEVDGFCFRDFMITK